jgi:hypothetical protein
MKGEMMDKLKTQPVILRPTSVCICRDSDKPEKGFQPSAKLRF